jgi:RimJ/RimL family protein N-acetyltransferase
MDMINITFQTMTAIHLPLWQKWIVKPHVKSVWFIKGYEPADYVHQKIKGNGYDYPFIIYLNDQPIGYIVCCDLYAYRTYCTHPKGLFTNAAPGTFCMDLFIGEETYLNQGYGTKIVKAFANLVLERFKANTVLIDPAVSNKRAIRCYEKAGFQYLRTAHDGVTECYIMAFNKKPEPKY